MTEIKLDIWELAWRVLTAIFIPFGVFLFNEWRKITKELILLREYENRIPPNLNSRVTELEIKIELFWQGITKKAGDYLHSPDNHHGLDRLIELNSQNMLTKDEAMEFRRLLELYEIKEQKDRLRKYFASVCQLGLLMRHCTSTEIANIRKKPTNT